jgi:hypothetical protein
VHQVLQVLQDHQVAQVLQVLLVQVVHQVHKEIKVDYYTNLKQILQQQIQVQEILD